MKTPINRIQQLIVALLSLMLFVPPSTACVQPVPVPDFWCKEKEELRALLQGLDCPEITACIVRAGREGKCLGGIGIEIDLFGASNTQCACGVALGNFPPELNLEVCAISILAVNKVTHQIIGKSNEMVFDQNAATQASLNGVFAGNWTGFFANVPVLNPVDFADPNVVWKLWLTTLSDLPISEFKNQGRIRIAAGEGNPNGTIQTDGEHPVAPLYEIALDGSNIQVGKFDPETGPTAAGPQIQVTGIDRDTAKQGDLIVVNGRGFGDNPDDLCVVMKDDNGDIVPFDAVGARDDRIVIKPRFIRPNPVPGPIMIERGNGGRFHCNLDDLVGCKIIGYPWCWDPQAFPGNPGVVDVNFQAIPPGEAPNVCVFPGSVNNGVICTFIDGTFPPGSKVQIYTRARDANNRGKDLGSMCLLTTAELTAEQMALCIKKYVECAFAQGNVAIEIKCETLTDGRVKITLSSVNGQPISWGNLDIRIRKGRPNGPVINAFVPKGNNQPRDLVVVRGANFGDDPDDLCFVARVGDGAVGLQVVAIEEDRLLARIENVPDDLVAENIMMQRGHGHRGPVVFAFDDIVPAGDVWAWQGAADFEVGVVPGAPDFQLIPPPPRPTDIYYQEQLVDGKLCTTIGPDNWLPGYRVTIFARAHTICEQVDLRIPRVRFLGGGTAEQCARRIKDMVVCAFRQQTGTLVNVTCTTNADGSVKITVERADGMAITWGKFEICIQCPVPIPDIDDDGIELADPVRDGIVQIPGTGFGENPDDLCLVVCNPGIFIPLDVVAVTDNLITARIGPVPPDVEPGPIMVMRGRGRQGPVVPALRFPDLVTPRDDAWLWQANDAEPVAVTERIFELIPPPPTNRRRCFFGKNVDGQICTIIEGDWVPGTALDIRIRAHNKEKGRFLDLGTRTITLTRQGTLQECADRIKDFGLCLQQQQANIPPHERIDIKCEQLNDNQIKMILCYQDGCPIEKGTFNIWAQIKGDMNDDGRRDVFDINPFVQSLVDPVQFRKDSGLDPGIFGDIDNDGTNNAFDIGGFAALLTGQGVPEAAAQRLRVLIPDEDFDGDGFTNASERLAGTDPDNPRDYLRFLQIAKGDEKLHITWASVPGKQYQIEYTEGLQNNSWTAVNGVPIAADHLETTFVDESPERAQSKRGFYRISVVSEIQE